MAATDPQVQSFTDGRYRPRAEQLRALRALYLDDKAALDPVYANLTAQSPTWVDSRTDVPQNVTKDDVLAFNAMLSAIETAVTNNGGANMIEKFCVRVLNVTFPTS